MNCGALHVVQVKVVSFEEWDKRIQGQVGNMLVVDCVEFIVFQELKDMRGFNGPHASIVQQGVAGLSKIIHVVHMRKYVIGNER